jgi:hypothetical protein
MLEDIGKNIKSIVEISVVRSQLNEIKNIFEKMKADFEKIKEESNEDKDKK